MSIKHREVRKLPTDRNLEKREMKGYFEKSPPK
jgi:hypothetical protein